jgi:ribosomal-protein-alanine N-acetyltransferase
MPARLQVRRAGPADLPALLALEQNFPGDRMSARSLRRLLAGDSAAIWVARAGGTTLGSLVLLMRRNNAVGRIYSVVVDPAARGQGIAGRLVNAAERHARLGKKALMSLEVRADNAPARALYRRLGYAETAVLRAYYEDGADGLRLRKPLPG